jgi:hypothetical protein
VTGSLNPLFYNSLRVTCHPSLLFLILREGKKMYIKGNISIDLKDTMIKIHPPKNFFGGVANLVKKGCWSANDECETFKIMALAQSIYRILKDMGVNNVVRVALGKLLIYDDPKNKPDDFPLAMEALQKKIEQGLDLGPLEHFKLVLKHDDGILTYVIVFNIVKEHKHGEYPITVSITAVSSKLHREINEQKDDYFERIKDYFSSQDNFDNFKNELEERFRSFFDSICDGFNTKLGIQIGRINKRWKTRFIRKEKEGDNEQDWSLYTAYDCPFYGYTSTWDLYFLSFWDDLFYDQGYEASQFEYVNPDGTVLTDVDDIAWSSDNFDTFVPSDSDNTSSDADANQSDSSSGGWLDSVSDFFSGGSDSDSSSDGGSSCSSCSGCGGD